MKNIKVDPGLKDLCAPVTVNSLLDFIRRHSVTLDKANLRRILDESQLNRPCSKFLSISISDANYEFLKKVRDEFQKTISDITLSATIELLRSIISSRTEQLVISLNVKGYGVPIEELKERLRRIASYINALCPDIILLQEFVTGDNMCVLHSFSSELNCKYTPVFPIGYDQRFHRDRCICLALVRKGDPVPLVINDHDGFDLRYNLFDLADMTFLNVWIPQTFDNSGNYETAKNMWNKIISVSRQMSEQKKEFYLMGDLNSFTANRWGKQIFGNKITELNSFMVNTKLQELDSEPTGFSNELDYAFASRRTVQTNSVITEIMNPSIKTSGLSDHDALVTRIPYYGVPLIADGVL